MLACMAMGLAKKWPGGAKNGMGMPGGMPGGMPPACACAAAALSSPGGTGPWTEGAGGTRSAHESAGVIAGCVRLLDVCGWA